MDSWTPESIRYEAFLRENKNRITLLGEIASISVLSNKYASTNKDVRSLFFSMSGGQMGMVWTFDGFLHNGIRGKYSRLDFAREADYNAFLVYSVTSMYRLFVQLRMEYTGGSKTLHVRDLMDIPVLMIGTEKECQVEEVANEIEHVQKTILPAPDEILDRIIEKELRLDAAQSPTIKNTKWAFECHAHHVTGLSWDHAKELEPLTCSTRTWLESSKLPLVAFKDIVSLGATSYEGSNGIYIPRNLAKLSQISIGAEGPNGVQRGWYKFCLVPNVDVNYIRYYLRSGFIKDYLCAMSNYGHSFLDNLMDVPIVLPEKSRQILISQSIDGALMQYAGARDLLDRHKSELQSRADALLFI